MLLLFWSPYHGKAPSHVKADAVSALSLLVSDDPQICLLMPDVVPSILGLLDKEDSIQVVKVGVFFLKLSCVSSTIHEIFLYVYMVTGCFRVHRGVNCQSSSEILVRLPC